jgi:hypothetical protein
MRATPTKRPEARMDEWTPIRLIDGEAPFESELLAPLVQVRPVAVYVDGDIVWTESDPDSPEAALMRYFAGIARQQLAKLPDPNAKPALSGLTKTAPGAKHGPGWCDE